MVLLHEVQHILEPQATLQVDCTLMSIVVGFFTTLRFGSSLRLNAASSVEPKTDSSVFGVLCDGLVSAFEVSGQLSWAEPQ